MSCSQILEGDSAEPRDVQLWSRAFGFDRCFDSMSTSGPGCATQVRARHDSSR